MEPKGERILSEVRDQLVEQVALCISCLHRMPNGEGILHKTTMTVNELGKISVYEYVHFLAQHGQRHLQQIQRVAAEYSLNGANA
jgi:hypothetical protein